MQMVMNLFERGGPIMWPLLACSVISLTVTIERIIFWWRKNQTRRRERLRLLFELVEQGDYGRAENLEGESSDYVLRVLLAGLIQRDHGLAEEMQVRAGDEIESMKRGLPVLDTIITMAPLLGILGTVVGIIESFNLLGIAGIADPKAVTGGIAQALITTAAGLGVALLTLIPFNYFVARVQRAAREIEQSAMQFEIACRKGIARTRARNQAGS